MEATVLKAYTTMHEGGRWESLESTPSIPELLEAIEAMRLRREAKQGTTMRPASQARRAPECASREAIASMRLLFVGRVGYNTLI